MGLVLRVLDRTPFERRHRGPRSVAGPHGGVVAREEWLWVGASPGVSFMRGETQQRLGDRASESVPSSATRVSVTNSDRRLRTIRLRPSMSPAYNWLAWIAALLVLTSTRASAQEGSIG